VLLSPYIAPATKTATPYNHFSMLGTVEDLFGLPRLADATATTAFGSDVFTQQNGLPPGSLQASNSPMQAAPHDSGLKLKPKSFAAKSHKHHGTTITYHDTEIAVTTLTIKILIHGYRPGRGGCKGHERGHKQPKHSKACTLTQTVGSFTHPDTAGQNTVRFSGRLHGHVLAPGSYLLEITPTLRSLHGNTISAHFRVI
jgi:hypothetical protein